MTSFSFDPASRLQSMAHDVAGTAQDVSLGFTYNPASQITSTTRSNDGYGWTAHYNVTRAYATNGLNQLTTAGSTALGYDARGNLTSSGSSAYAYSSENYLKTAPNSVTLVYDPALRLYQMAGAGGGVTATTRFGYDGVSLIAEYDGANTLLRRYVHGPGTDAPLVWYEGAGLTDRRWYHADERGSVIGISNASATVTNINAYDEYGIPQSTNVGRFGYTGQSWLPEIGMNYYKARMYSPTLGRFMQTDPIGYGDGMNWYAYVGSDPVNGRDPSGLKVTCANGAIAVNTAGCSGNGGMGPTPGQQPAGGDGGTTTVNGRRSEPANPDAIKGFLDRNGSSPMGGGREGGDGGENVGVDKSCANVPAAKDPSVQAKALQTLRLGQTAQQRKPNGPRFREYGFSGRPYFLRSIFGNGYVTGDIESGSETNVTLTEGYFDTFDVHSHPDPADNLGPSRGDVLNTPSGHTSIVINPDKTLRCYTRP